MEILLASFDWLRVGIRFDDARSLINYRNDFSEVHKIPYYETLDFLGRKWGVRPHRYRKGLVELISEEGFLLDININEKLGNDYPLSINLKKPERSDMACLLWEDPINGMQKILDEFALYYGNLTYSITQVDLACHFQGWEPKVADMNNLWGNFPIGPHKNLKMNFTGFTIGNSKNKNKKAIGTIYNINERIEDIPGSYLPHPYYPNHINTIDDVWNLEFKIFGSMLREYSIHSLSDLSLNVGAIWAHLTKKRLKLFLPSQDTNKRRWELNPVWLKIQNAYGEPIKPLERVRKNTTKLSAGKKTKKVETALMSLIADLECCWDLSPDKKIEYVLGLLDLNRFENSSIVHYIADRR